MKSNVEISHQHERLRRLLTATNTAREKKFPKIILPQEIQLIYKTSNGARDSPARPTKGGNGLTRRYSKTLKGVHWYFAYLDDVFIG